ncbi:hypothetical protein DEJ23_05980 [Curtobacterium sp. MCSS17_008]|uniref:hypothetical protein n=1 Tax=Curtobacterium sp. MCSS17_008 TaxID=2175647 RepID=UPI000DA9B4D6|nr:hypothetical protein [Curtobacterium sp. MCSS17_008]PZF57689.1 hypothetical protein DEJ23_05980 [Curtobacterium sp. MCSS17_008]
MGIGTQCRKFPAIANGIGVTLVDAAFVAVCAALLWINGQTTVIDAPASALVVIVMIGGVFVAVRVGVGSRYTRMTPGVVAAERTTVLVQLLFLIALVVAWRATGAYELGWGVTFGSVALVVGNALLLMTDVTTASLRDASRQARVHARRLASMEVLHIGAALMGVVGTVVTSPIHMWRNEILNGSILIVATAIGLGNAVAALMRRNLKRHRGVPRGASQENITGA